MFRVVYAQAGGKCSRMLTVVGLLLASQLVWTSAAHAVCEELFSQMFSRTLDLRSASKGCRSYIEKNVRAHAVASTLIEYCRKKKNYSARYKTSVYRVTRRCVEKKSARWLIRKYNGTRAEQLKQLRASVGISLNTYCKQANIISYLKKAELALSKPCLMPKPSAISGGVRGLVGAVCLCAVIA